MSFPPPHNNQQRMEFINQQQVYGNNTSSDVMPSSCNNNNLTSASDVSGNNNGVVKMSKIISCQIQGTMNAFNVMGPNAATWKPVDGKQVDKSSICECFNYN